MRIENPPSATILHGTGVPAGAPILAPLDGVNDPWRWKQDGGVRWVGPAVEVTVAAGAVLDLSGVSLPAGADEVDVYVTSATTLNRYPTNDTSSLLTTSGLPATAGVSFGSGSGGETSDPAVGGTGIAYLVQFETGYPSTPGTVPDASLDVAALLATYGTGFTVGSAYDFPETPEVGAEGDFYIDTTTGNMYGPKTSGAWPGPIGFGTVVLASPGGTLYRIVVDDLGALSTDLV